jgi:hypothetical protein
MEIDALTDQDIVNLFMGLVRLIKRQYNEKIAVLEKEIAALSGAALVGKVE